MSQTNGFAASTWIVRQSPKSSRFRKRADSKVESALLYIWHTGLHGMMKKLNYSIFIIFNF